jgi:DNA polymerase-3 subunit delta'
MNVNWGQIYGHNRNREVLDRIISSSKIPHAFLFIGKQGIGKDYVALQFAQSINNKFASEQELSKVQSGLRSLSEPYIKYIFALPRGKNETDESTPYEKLNTEELDEIKEEIDKKISNPYYRIKIDRANTIKVSSIRDINKFLSMQFEQSFYRFILISDAHLMNETSQNALLKNLEEPPERVIFILTTPYPELLRETIKSRCWQLYFNPLNHEDLKQILIDYFKINNKLAEEVTVFSEGSTTTANYLIEHDFLQLKDKTISFLRYALGKKFHSAYSEISDILADGDSSNLKIFIQMIITWLNDLQRFRTSNSGISFKNYQDTLEKFERRYPKSQISDVVFKIDYLNSLIQNNINPNLLVVNLIFIISSLTN